MNLKQSRGSSSLIVLIVIADLVWACICAAFGGTILHFVAGLFGATSNVVETGTILGGAIGFIAGIFSGLAMMFVVGMIILFIGIIFGKKR